jgi:hypothetical protein
MHDEHTYATLEVMRQRFSAMNWREALPAALPEPWLGGLARDLHSVDTGRLQDGDPKRPLFLVACIATGRAQEQRIEAVLTDDHDAALLLTGYQFLVHREVVNRSMNFQDNELEKVFLELVDQLLVAKACDPGQTH